MTAPVVPTEPVEPPADPPAGDPPKPEPDTDKPLGPAGERALAAERKRAADAERELAKYRKAEQDKADADKSETEKRTAAEARADAAEQRALRLEIASEKGLTAAQAKRLIGSTRDELESDADALIADFAGQPAAKKAAPRPDPSQGARGEPAPKRATNLITAVAAQMKPPSGP